MGTFANLREVREKLVGFSRENAARLSALPLDRLRAIEEGDSPSVYEIETLADLYGLDALALSEEPIHTDPGDAVQLLMSAPEFVEVSDVVRARIVASATAARDARRLQKLNGLTVKGPELGERHVPDRRAPPFRRGSLLADYARKTYGLGSKPIVSVRDFVRDNFPGVLVLYADLTREGPAGVTYFDHQRGATIVLNLLGKNVNPAVRRFSLAHELCHVLLDAHHVTRLAVVSGYLSDRALDTERCANAFAVRFLCPEKELKKLERRSTPEATIRALLEEFGLHYAAARLYLRNVTGSRPLSATPPPALSGIGTDLALDRAEAPEGIENFPLPAVPPERRTAVAMDAAKAYSDKKIGRDEFADLLRLTPAAELETVLDFFGLPLPSDQMVA